MAQVHASAPGLRMITFDADGTLYDDGAHFEQDNAMIRKIIALMRAGVHVGIVTAAGRATRPPFLSAAARSPDRWHAICAAPVTLECFVRPS